MTSSKNKFWVKLALASALTFALPYPASAQEDEASTAISSDAETDLHQALEAELAADGRTAAAPESMVIPEVEDDAAPAGNTAPGPAVVQQLTLAPADPLLQNLTPTKVENLNTKLWANMPPELAVELMRRIRVDTLPPVAQSLLHRMLLSDATLGTALGVQFYEKRILLLFDLGDWNSVNVFVSRAFAAEPNPALAEMLLALQLINNGLPGACKIKSQMASALPESLSWATHDLQYLDIACQLLAGQRAEADLALNLRTETGKGDPTFERLYLAMADNAELDDLQQAADQAGYFRRLLYLAMARAANANPALLGARPDRLSDLPTLLLSKGTRNDTRMLTAEKAFAAGRLKQADLETIYTRLAASGGQDLPPLMRETLAKHRTMKAFANEMEVPNIKGYIHALAEALANAQARGQTEMAATLYATTILNMRADQAEQIDTGIVARTLAETGDFESARDWFMEAYFLAQNGNTQSRNGQAFANMTLAWPLMAMAPNGAAPRGVENLADGLMEHLSPATQETDRRKAALLFALMEGFGRPPHGPLWDSLLPSAETTGPAVSVDHTLWRGMEAAAEEDEIARTLLFMLAGLSAAPIEQQHPAFITACVDALISIGLEDEGRKLAVEALVAAGF